MPRFEVRMLDHLRPVAPRVVLYDLATPERIAVLQGPMGRLAWDGDEDALAARLLGEGWRAVACVRRSRTGAALARMIGPADHADHVAAAVWGLCALGGWDETPVIGVMLDHALWMARAIPGRPSAHVDAMPGRDEWDATPSESSEIVVLDIDHLLAFNDAYGHEEGDLALARIAACVTEQADDAGARAYRVAGGTFACIGHTRTMFAAPAVLAESIRAAVDALAIPLEHPEVRTSGRLTVTCGVGRARDARELSAAREALLDAKAHGRNRVHSLG